LGGRLAAFFYEWLWIFFTGVQHGQNFDVVCHPIDQQIIRVNDHFASARYSAGAETMRYPGKPSRCGADLLVQCN